MPRRFSSDQSGAALAEFLIVLPVLLLLIVGSFHVGYYVVYYHSVEKAVRNGARYLARVPQAAIGGWADTRARNLMLSGTITSATPPLLAGWTDPGTISITPVWRTITDPVDPNRLAVRVTAVVPLDIPVLAAFGFEDPIQITAVHEERHIGE